MSLGGGVEVSAGAGEGCVPCVSSLAGRLRIVVGSILFL